MAGTCSNRPVGDFPAAEAHAPVLGMKDNKSASESRHGTRAGAQSKVPAQTPQGRGDDAPARVRPFQIRGRFMTAIAIRVESETPNAAFFEALDAQLEQSPQLLEGAPLVIDFEKVPGLENRMRIGALVDELRKRRLLVFGVQNAGPKQVEAAEGLGLIPVKVGREAPLPEPSTQRKRKIDRLLPPDNRVITHPVRSGQMVVAERGDLTIIGSVSSGAELVAAGNIHVYGRMRGRAMAGCHGDESARIFCQSQSAELLAIAGLYRTSESIGDDLGNCPVQVFLKDDRLCVEALA
ncbi:septum site-determining protein MinC [Citreicella sp. SE45]|nr:septum site-determining protein MinC [Citreicella sp. SE45]